MNWIPRSTLLRMLGLALLAACFNAGHASAQVFQGKFTLPFEARWGQATLPAGNYSFTLDSLRMSCMLRLHRGKNNVALIMAQSQYENKSGEAKLTLVGGTVRALRLPEIGVVLQYSPHHAKYLTAPEERKMAQNVPVTKIGT